MDLPDSVTRRRAILGGVGTILAGSGVVYGASTLESDQQATAAKAPLRASSETTGFGIDLEGHPIMGSSDAAVDMYYWSDYHCPFCRRFERNAFRQIRENQVQSGTVRVVFIEFPYLKPSSMTAAVMDRCVWRQVQTDTPRAYWRWHAAVFEAQRSGSEEWASTANLLDITAGVEGVDAGAVESCMDEHGSDIEASIEADVQQASQYGIKGTPGFVLYNRDAEAAGKLVGAQPYDRFETAISRVKNA